MLGKAPAEGIIGSAEGCSGRASGTLLGLRKGRGGKGTGRGRIGKGEAGQARQMQSCSRARGLLLFLTRQVFFPFSIFSPYFSALGPMAPWTGTWMGPAAGVGTTWAPVQLSQRGLGLGLSLGTWAWTGRHEC